MFVFWVLLISSLLIVQPTPFASAADEDRCHPVRCKESGPEVRFPFWLEGRQPQDCGFPLPGFNLSCDVRSDTIFQFQFSLSASASASASAQNIIITLPATANVSRIDYTGQTISGIVISNESCLPHRVPGPESNSSASPFQLQQLSYPYDGYTLFNCSGVFPHTYVYPQNYIACLEHGAFRVYATSSYDLLSDVSSLSSCAKMYDVSDISPVFLNDFGYRDYTYGWSNPDCRRCESKGKYCRRNTRDESNGTECYDKPPDPNSLTQHKKDSPVKVIIPAVVVGVLLTTIILGVLFTVYRTKKKKRDDERKIVQFLEDYRALRPTRYSYSDIKKMTEGFKHKLGRGGYGTVFKGMLLNEIPVAIKILNCVKGNGNDFINEVGTIGNIHHANVVRLVGYCADGYRRALVYEYLENDSLEKYITWGNQRSKLGWEKLFEIVVGIAKGIEYLHQGCNQRILHFDIKPHNILLDENLHPKVADFGLAKLCSKEKSVITMTAVRGTIGYIAPEVFSRNFGRVSYKSDIYSFGMVVLNLVGGRKNYSTTNVHDESQVYFPEWMYEQLEKEEDIEFQVESKSDISLVKRMITVGLWCIQWYPIDRPSMKMVIQMLESENMPIMPPNPFAATDGNDTFADAMGSLSSSGKTTIDDGNRGKI